MIDRRPTAGHEALNPTDQEIVTTDLWAKKPPPPLSPDATPIGDWELLTPVDLTTSREQLRRRLQQIRTHAGGHREDVDRLLLAFEELASNALRHGRAPVRIRVVPAGDGWLIDASDAAPDLPPIPAVQRDPAGGGLGLYLVARLCSAHGWTAHDHRKHVWASIHPAPR